MALAKVAAVIYARKLILAKDKEIVDRFLGALSPEERDRLLTLLPPDKLPIEQVTRFHELSAAVLFPDKPLEEGLWQLGYQNAQHDMRGIYKVLLRVATVEMVVKNAAVVWKTYHDQGKAYVRTLSNKEFVFIVENYPDIPKNFNEVMNGYITGLLDLTGAKNVKVVRDDSNPDAWKWNITVE